MPEIVPLLVCLNELLTPTTARQLRQIIFALLCSPDRITMLGLSRWTERRAVADDQAAAIEAADTATTPRRIVAAEGTAIQRDRPAVVEQSGPVGCGVVEYIDVVKRQCAHAVDATALAAGRVATDRAVRQRDRAAVAADGPATALNAEQIVDYYALRFQIEFNFRDAKQYWGLEDFMNVRQ